MRGLKISAFWGWPFWLFPNENRSTFIRYSWVKILKNSEYLVFQPPQKTFLYFYAHNFTSLLFIHEPAIKMSKALTNISFIDESVNISQIISTIKEVDFFAGIYESQIVLWSIGITYFLGLIGCIALRFIIWFERSGQAGNFRTLVNQLVSYNLEQVRYNFLKILNLEELYLLKSFPNFYRVYTKISQ